MSEAYATGGDNKAGLDIGKVLQRKVSRTKEKMMQSLGRNDKTTDGEFDQLSAMFVEQQAVASRLNAEFKNYVKQVKVLQTASESLQLAIKGAYESQWPDSTTYYEFGEKLTISWSNYVHQLDEAQADLTVYFDKFTELKQKIAKRGRKQTDYDCARHNVQSLDSAKRRDSFKITKAQNEMMQAKQVYETLNAELLTELKDFYNSRVSSICSYLKLLYDAEAAFLLETAEVKRQLAHVAKDAAAFRPAFSSVSSTKFPSMESPTSPLSSVTEERATGNDYEFVDDLKKPDNRETSKDFNPKSPAAVSSPAPLPSITSRDSFDSSGSSEPVESPQKSDGIEPFYSVPTKRSSVNKPQDQLVHVTPPPLLDLNNDIPTNANDKKIVKTTSDKPVKYQVVAIFDYDAADEDELTFKIGDTINVIDFDDPDEMDEGWLMGIHDSTGHKGILPENFTRKL